MNASLLLLLLGSIAYVMSVIINFRASARLTPEQRLDVKAAMSVRAWLIIPQLITFWVVIDFMGMQISHGRFLALIWAVPLLVILAWEQRQFRLKHFPASYLKSHLIGESLFVGGVSLLFLVL